MYYIYNVEKKDHICSYSFIDEIKLFGSVNGIIVKILQKLYLKIKMKKMMDTNGK